jgi:hypothetical protein
MSGLTDIGRLNAKVGDGRLVLNSAQTLENRDWNG